MSYFVAFVLSFLIAALVVPSIRKLATKRGWVDGLEERKIHKGPIPRLGGIGIGVGFFCALLLMIGGLKLGGIPVPISPKLFILILGAVGFHLLGLWDDFRDLKARTKFLIQLALAAAVVAAGFQFHFFWLPVLGHVELGLFGPIITAIWIVGIANAMNLIDGMDGLAAGIALIGVAVWGILLFKSGLRFEGIIAAAIGGGIFGFLFYNFPPASIFMGDSGSLLLGYMLAVLPLLGNLTTAGGMQLVPAISLAFIPILDTFAAMLRRWRRGQSFFTPDKYHVHHKLLDLGFSARSILIIIYGLCIILGASVMASVYANPIVSFWLMMGGWFLSGGIFVILHFLGQKGIRIYEQSHIKDTVS